MELEGDSMNLKNQLHKLLLEKGAKRAKDEKMYYFLSDTTSIVDKHGFKYTISKVTLEPEILIQCYRSDIDPDEGNKFITITKDEFENYYGLA